MYPWKVQITNMTETERQLLELCGLCPLTDNCDCSESCRQ